jgi:23S rRNA pseudouridine2605 synthase
MKRKIENKKSANRGVIKKKPKKSFKQEAKQLEIEKREKAVVIKKKDTFKKKEIIDKPKEVVVPNALIRLNKYIADSGICSRRDADNLIAAGEVMVNGKVVTEMGFRVSPTDDVQWKGKKLRREKLVYVLLNKPKDYITTMEDPQERQTVMNLVADACRERIYPVGRLDRTTTGLLLMTNDGELAKQLSHPRYKVQKVYHAELSKPITPQDMQKIADGVELEDGKANVDAINYSEDTPDKRCVGIELHMGKNRIVRRIFESLGYDVVRLDRVYYAGLTKKDLPRGRWRFLTGQEIAFLKMGRFK